MSDRPSSGGAGLSAIVNASLLMATLAGGLLFVSTNLTSDRPSAPRAPSSVSIWDQSVGARLWEDPLPPATNGESLRSFDDVVHQLETQPERALLVLPVMVDGGPYSEDQEQRIRSRFAVVSALGGAGYAPVDAEHIGIAKLDWWPSHRDLRALKQQPAFDFDAVRLRLARLSQIGERERVTLRVGYEWYRPRVFHPRAGDAVYPSQILVLWIDDGMFEDDPLLRLPLLLAPTVRGRSDVDIRIIGPQRSSTLRKMLPEWRAAAAPMANGGVAAAIVAAATPLAAGGLETWSKTILGRIELYSATATAMDEVLVEAAPAAPATPPRRVVHDQLVASGVKDVHFLNATDVDLAAEIFAELKRRDVDLSQPENHLVLLSEWDTFYGRMLKLTYGASLSELGSSAFDDGGEKLDRSSFVQRYRSNPLCRLPDNLHSLVFLRGLDGRTADAPAGGAGKAAQNGRGRTRPSSLDDVLRWKPDSNKAEGPNQFDYLSRTAAALDALQDELLLEGPKHRIRAIGIVGSDVYDVLLILQALRPRFPDVWFFTTGLDARLWNPEELAWSRNLIVASSFGLTLNPKLQREVPPFRDGAQTAKFAATLAALDEFRFDDSAGVPAPRLFEIGNRTAVDLSMPERSAALAAPPPRLHPATTSEVYAAAQRNRSRWTRPMRYSLLIVAALIGLAAYYYWNPFRRRSEYNAGYVSQVLYFTDPDLGDASATARALVANDDPLSRWMTRALADDDSTSAGSPLRQAEPPAAAPLAGEAGADRALHDRRSFDLLALLNRIVVHADQRVDEQSVLASRLVNPSLAAAAAPWAPPAKGLSRLRQRLRTRRFLNAFLTRVSEAGDAAPSMREVANDARSAAVELCRVRINLIRVLLVLAVAVVAAGIAIGLCIWNDTYTVSGGEPFSLVSGVSAWPNLLLRIVSTLVALGLIAVLIEKLRAMFFDLTRHYRLPYSTDAPRPCHGVQAMRLWREFYTEGSLKRRLMRALPPCLLYFGLARLIIMVTGDPFLPVRGSATLWCAEIIRFPFVLSFLLLSFLTIDAALRCRRFIKELAAAPTVYPQTTLDYFASQRGDVAREYLDEWIDTQLIADLTERVVGLLWFPAIVYVLMLASLNQWTDYWPASNGLLVILTLNLALSISSVAILQRAAQEAKRTAEATLYAKVKRAQQIAAPTPRANDAAQAEKLLDEIRSLRRGAYRGFWENPVLGAVLLPSGGTAMYQLFMWLSNR